MVILCLEEIVSVVLTIEMADFGKSLFDEKTGYKKSRTRTMESYSSDRERG